jgi:hypothetical protein
VSDTSKMPSATGSTAPDAPRNPMRWKVYARPYLYILLVIGIPYLILAGSDGFPWTGFPRTFHNGEASIFMCGVLVAMFGETLIEQLGKGRKPREWGTIVLFVLFGAGIFFAWNITYALKPRLGPISQLDNVAIVAFVIAAIYAPFLRFADDASAVRGYSKNMAILLQVPRTS